MNKCKYLIVGLLSIVSLSSFMAPKKAKEDNEPKRIYLYGVSIDFNDSTVYITDMQHLDDIVINKDGSLLNYANYSLQLKLYLEGTLGETNQTCGVIYSDDKRKLEKRYIKMRKKYQADKNKMIRQIGTDSFVFLKE